MKLLDKLSESGSLQLALLLNAAVIAMLLLDQCGTGIANGEFIKFVLSVDMFLLGLRGARRQ